MARPSTPTIEQLITDLPVTELEKPDGGRVYLLGTAHTSQESAAHAVCLMRAVRPSAVVVELCKGRRHMLASGYAHAFSIDAEAPPEDLKHQASAIGKGRGMWEKGAPEGLLTSLHSADEREDGSAYNRLCSLTTGLCDKAPHGATYSTCQEVCEQGSCMLYVPYKQRYGEARADCLR